MVDVRLSNKEFVNKVQPGDKITFEPNDIDFGSQNVARSKKSSVGKKGTKKRYFIRGYSLVVQSFWNGRFVGYLSCEHEEIFVFLLLMDYIFLEGIALCKPNDSAAKLSGTNRFKVQINIFMTDKVIKNPLKIITKNQELAASQSQTPVPRMDEYDEEESEEF